MKELIKVVSKKLFILSIIINAIFSIADYGQAFAFSRLANGTLTLDKIIKLTVCFFILDLIMLIFGKLGSYVDNVNDVNTQTAIQKYYFGKLQNMTMDKIANTHTGFIHKLITKVSYYFCETVWQIKITIVPLVIGGTSILFMVCKQSLTTGLICILISIIAVYLKYIMLQNKQKYEKQVNEAESKYNANYIDFIQNIIAVRKLNIGRFCNRKIDENSKEYLKATKANERQRSNTNGIFTLMMNLLNLIVLGSTIFIVARGEDGLSYLLFYMTALGKLNSDLNHFVKLIDITQKTKVSKKQLDDYFKDCKEIKLINKYNNVKLKNVVFSYTKDSAKIKIPEFILKKGDKISIVGESGQGKTTVMNILAGLYSLEKGKLLIDNKEIKDVRLDLVFVSQEVDLFDLSIRDNLCLGKDIPESKILDLIEEAGMMNWYKELPKGLDTMVGEKGIKLSAGQKQRLNLIRGILIDKDLYFFDEPTSNLDVVSEEKIINMIDKYLKDKTYVIVTHRPKLKELCNKHYVFEEHMMKEILTTV